MIDAEQLAQQTVSYATGYPRDDLPTYFVDMLTSASKGPGFIKTYAAKIDPKVDGTVGIKITPIAQLVFSFHALLNTLAFLEVQVEGLVKQGDLPQEAVDIARETLRKGLNIA